MLFTAHFVSGLMTVHSVLITVAFVGSFGIGKCEPSDFALPFQDCLWPLEFPYEF